MHQRRFRTDVALVFGEFFLGLAFSLGRDDGGAEEDLDVGGSASQCHRLCADIVHDVLDPILALAVDEDALCMRGGELTATGRGAGLIQHRRALWRRLRQMHGVDLILASTMMDDVYFGWIGVETVSAIDLYGAVFPAAFPELVDQLHV